MSSAEFEPTILAIELPQSYALDSAPTGIGAWLGLRLVVFMEGYKFWSLSLCSYTCV